MIVPGSIFSADRPSNKIAVGIIGWGMQGPQNTDGFLAETDCKVVAVCDVDKKHLQAGGNAINGYYQNRDCAAYHDYRELLTRQDIDAVMIAVPDHWHALVYTEAARQKKDIYGEKPLAKTIAEQQAIVRAVQQNRVVFQTGSWRRSQASYRRRVRLSATDSLEKFRASRSVCWEATLISSRRTMAWSRAKSPHHHRRNWIMRCGLDRQNCFLTSPARSHMNWRWNYNTGGGMLMDWIGHHCDIAHWGMDCDRSGPSEIEGHGDFPPKEDVFNAATRYRIELKYPQDIHMTIAGGYDDIEEGAKWIGTDGWVQTSSWGGFNCSNPDWKKGKNLPDELRKVRLYESPGHVRNFLDSVKLRQPTVAPVETGHHSTIPGHLGLISMLTGRKIRWNVENEEIIGDADASKLLTREISRPVETWVMMERITRSGVQRSKVFRAAFIQPSAKAIPACQGAGQFIWGA